MSDHEVFGASTIAGIIEQLKKMAASDEDMAQVLCAVRVRPNATVRIQRACRRYLKRKDASGAAAGFDAGADDGLEQFAMHHVERANEEVGDLVQKYATLKRKFLDATAETHDNGGVPIANYIVSRIDHNSDIFMPAECGLPRFRYKKVSVLLGRHPEIRVRLDMYEYAEGENKDVLPDVYSTDSSYEPADTDIDNMLIIPANSGHRKVCDEIERHLREVHPVTGVSYHDLLDSDCPFYISYINFWHNGPKNNVRDPDRGDKAPTFDPDTSEHHIGLSVRWTPFRVH
jgi:hypothetical protein